jgi:hypothetical protein
MNNQDERRLMVDELERILDTLPHLIEDVNSLLSRMTPQDTTHLDLPIGRAFQQMMTWLVTEKEDAIARFHQAALRLALGMHYLRTTGTGGVLYGGGGDLPLPAPLNRMKEGQPQTTAEAILEQVDRVQDPDERGKLVVELLRRMMDSEIAEPMGEDLRQIDKRKPLDPLAETAIDAVIKKVHQNRRLNTENPLVAQGLQILKQRGNQGVAFSELKALYDAAIAEGRVLNPDNATSELVGRMNRRLKSEGYCIVGEKVFFIAPCGDNGMT